MSTFTEYASADEIYAATNPYMRFAIGVLDAGYSHIDKSHSAIAYWYDNLLPVELKALNYQPAIQLMHDWINLFFANCSRGGLIPTLAQLSGRRTYRDAQTNEPAGWVHTAGDLRLYGVLEGRYASTVTMIRRMHEFLTWVPDGLLPLHDQQSLLVHCQAWATAFSQPNAASQWYGHRVTPSSWQLYNFVHTGPPPAPLGMDEQTYANPANFPGDFNERFDRAFRFALEGFPDSWWVMVDGYGAVAQAFVHLAKVSGQPAYAEFAQTVTEGLWQARLNHATYLMPDTVTPLSPLPGDQAAINGQWKYLHDTDCLYWARALFDAYSIVWQGQPSLAPIVYDPQAALPDQICQRRSQLTALLSGDFPDKYLGMALGLTIDWIQYGWNPQAKQFIRKIAHDGTPGTTVIYGDGKWNTLYILIEAYRFTHDHFYLDIFDQAWQTFKRLANSLGGLFPVQIVNGALPASPVPNKCSKVQFGPDNVECSQEFFLDVIVSAYCATLTAGQPCAVYLEDAKALANKLLAEATDGNHYDEPSHGVLGGALVRLAQAQGTLY